MRGALRLMKEIKYVFVLDCKGPVINTLAEKYAGGGHPLASGATVKNWEEFDDLLDDMARVVAEYLKENNIKLEN